MSVQVEETRDVRRALARAQAYGLLARAFGRPDSAFLSEIRGGHFRRGLKAALTALDWEDAEAPRGAARTAALQSEFVRLFSPSAGANCPPYETEYTGAHVFMRAQQLADIAGFYRAFGLQLAAGFRERPDHIAAELEFMHVLALKEARALARGEEENAETCRRAQASFVGDHLGRWLAPYAERLASLSEASFYARVASLSSDFVARDAESLGVRPEVATARVTNEPEPALECPAEVGETSGAG